MVIADINSGDNVPIIGKNRFHFGGGGCLNISFTNVFVSCVMTFSVRCAFSTLYDWVIKMSSRKKTKEYHKQKAKCNFLLT